MILNRYSMRNRVRCEKSRKSDSRPGCWASWPAAKEPQLIPTRGLQDLRSTLSGTEEGECGLERRKAELPHAVEWGPLGGEPNF